MKKRSIKRRLVIGLIIMVLVGLIWPQSFENPVQNANKRDYNAQSFWYYPWGKSGTHKGVDIFAKKGTSVNAATGGLVLYCGEFAQGGNVVLVIGPKWRVHYYAHLEATKTHLFSWLSKGEQIGTVGTSGNAKGKSPHLHYSISTLIPYPWRVDQSPQGWKKMFYLNPIDFLENR